MQYASERRNESGHCMSVQVQCPEDQIGASRYSSVHANLSSQNDAVTEKTKPDEIATCKAWLLCNTAHLKSALDQRQDQIWRQERHLRERRACSHGQGVVLQHMSLL